jgi:hypothetical protein
MQARSDKEVEQATQFAEASVINPAVHVMHPETLQSMQLAEQELLQHGTLIAHALL